MQVERALTGCRGVSGAFATDWLDLREPVDAVARSHAGSRPPGRLAPAARAAARGGSGGRHGRQPALVGIALGGEQDWTLVELDPALIAAGEGRLRPMALSWRYRRLDLAADLEQLAVEHLDLITASALLDW